VPEVLVAQSFAREAEAAESTALAAAASAESAPACRTAQQYLLKS